MNTSLGLVVCGVLITLTAQAAAPKSDREFAGLKGPVHQVSHGSQAPSIQDTSRAGESETYDESGNLTATVEVGADAYLQHTYVHIGAKTVYEYWGEKPVPPGTKGDDSRFSAEWVYKYDGSGNRIEKSIFDRKGTLTSRLKYTYDRKGGLISQSTEVGGVVREELKFTRDGKGNVILLTNDTHKTTYQYVQFDSSGNWTQRIIISLGIKEGEAQPTLQKTPEERILTYY